MENRFSRASSQRSATTSDLDDALYPVYHQYRPGPSLAISTSGRRPPPSPSRDYIPARSSSPEDVFADPADSPPPSPSGSAFYSSSIVTPTPSVRRPSLSLSARRSPSPLPGGPNAGYYPHHRLSQSLTPSVRSSSSSTYGHGGNGLNRSNTTGTTGTGYSTLSSIPSNLSDFTSPPTIAPVRPQWNYGGHQQNIYPESVNTGSVVPEEMDDPFADDFMIPVGDGFAPHHERPPPAVVFPSGASSVGSIEPPPYTRYPDQPKPEVIIGAPLRMHVSNGDSGVDIGREEGDDEDDDRRNSRRGVLSAAGGVGLLSATGAIRGGAGGGGGDPGDDGSGAHKEWQIKRWMGFRVKSVILGVAIGLLILLAVGLGVGLGVGLHHDQSSGATTTVYPTTTADMPPTSEETGPPLSSPNDTFPAIPTGLALLSPLTLSEKSSSCDIIAQDASTPSWFDMGADLLWSCAYDQDNTRDALTWRFERFPVSVTTNMEKFNSEPDFLRAAEYGEGIWGGYLVSSVEGIQIWEDNDDLVIVNDNGDIEEYSGRGVWRDGMQNQAFWRIPFAFYNESDSSSKSRNKGVAPRWHKSRLSARGLLPRSDSHPLDDSYKFGILFNKTVIVKQSTIDKNINRKNGVINSGNGTALIPGEIVWKCVWEKTLLEVEVMADVASAAVTQSKETSGQEEEINYGNGSDSDNDDDDDDEHHNPGPTHTHHGGCPRRTDCPHDNDRPFPTDGPPPPPPPPPSHHYDEDNFFGLKPPTPTSTSSTSSTSNGNLTYKLKIKQKQKRQVYERTAPAAYPLRVSLKESRPSGNRIRQLLGMDLTDPDPKGRANLGAVKCMQYVVRSSGSITPLVDTVTGEGYVVMEEQGNGKGRLRERGEMTVAALRGRNSGCFCNWNS